MTILIPNIFIILICTNIFSQVPTAGLVGHYPFSENAKDASPTANHGTVNGASLAADRFGTANSCYRFDGVNDYISISNHSAYKFSSYTISLWFKYLGPSATANQHWELINKNATRNDKLDPFSIAVFNPAIEPNNIVHGRAADGGSVRVISDPIRGENYNQWNHVAIVFDNSMNIFRLYFNGVAKTSNTAAFDPVVNTSNINIGRWEGFLNYFNGLIDDVRIYNIALNPTQISELFNSEIQPPVTSTLAPVPYYFITDNVNGNPQYYCGDPSKGTYAGIFTMENYNVLAYVLGDNPSDLLRPSQSLVAPERFRYEGGGSVTIQPFVYTEAGNAKKYNLPLGPRLKAFLNDPLNGAKFDLTLPFSHPSVALSNQSAHLRIDERQNGVHTAIDFDYTGNVKQTFDIVAAADGIIAGNETNGGAIVIKHRASNGKEFLTIYQHLDPESKRQWSLNASISRGELIGRVDNLDSDGNLKEAHLHFAVAVRGPAKAVQKGNITVPSLWYLIDPFGVYDYRRNQTSSTQYNYLPADDLTKTARGVLHAYVWRTNPPSGSQLYAPYELPVGASRTVTVKANEKYNITEVFVRHGQNFSFSTTSPEWNNGKRETTCNGYSAIDLRRHGDIEMMAMVGEIFENHSYTGSYFKIGCSRNNVTMARSGLLMVFANDLLTDEAYSDNSRVVTLTITRVE